MNHDLENGGIQVQDFESDNDSAQSRASSRAPGCDNGTRRSSSSAESRRKMASQARSQTLGPDNSSQRSSSSAESRRKLDAQVRRRAYLTPEDFVKPGVDNPGPWLAWFHRKALIVEITMPGETFLSKLYAEHLGALI
jgi:hypothetical protein